MKAYTQAAEKEFKGESDSLKAEGQKLQQQLAILAPNVKNQKIAAFEKRQKAFQEKVQSRQDMIQGGVMQARQEVEKALGPILQGIMAERGANLLMDRSAIVLGTVDVDVTALAIDRLNKKLPAVKVESGGAAEGRAGAAIGRAGRLRAPPRTQQWPILASSTIAVPSRWRSCARRSVQACRTVPIRTCWCTIWRRSKGRGRVI